MFRTDKLFGIKVLGNVEDGSEVFGTQELGYQEIGMMGNGTPK